MAEEIKKEKKVVKADEVKPAKKTVKAEEPAEKPEAKKKTVSTATGEKKVESAKPVGNAGSKRAGAVVFWVLGLICEIISILALVGKINVTFVPTLTFIIGMLVIDLIFVIIGSQLWKKANHIDPASKKNKTKFFLWNNMGVIACIIDFLPYIILLLKDKNLDAKTRKIALVAACAALLIGGACSVDYNPVSQEEKDTAIEVLGEDSEVVWTKFGKVYHTSQDCQHLNNSDTIIVGTVAEGIAAGKTRLCKTCAQRDGVADVEGLALSD